MPRLFIQMKFRNKKSVKRLISLLLILSWLLTSWPGLPFSGIPPLVKEVQAITCGFGAEIGTSGVCRGFLTVTGSNQTWTSPSDWDNSNNTIECIGAGGSGGAVKGSSTATATGGGGGAYSLINDFYVANPGTTQITYRIGLGGTSVSSSGTATGGNTGEDTWFNSSTFPGSGTDNSYCGAKGGSGGNAGAATQNGGPGGVGTSGWGETRRSGGSGGTASHSSVATGGGGTAGNSSTGGNGVSSTATNQATNGGQANGSGATGGTGGTTGGAGNNGTEYTTEGSGGGGGGGRNTGNIAVTGGSGGKRGGGGGGAVNYRTQANGSASSGAGYAGIIVITYTPIIDSVLTQNDWRIYVDDDTLALTSNDPWPSGTLNLGENEALVSVPLGSDPLDPADNIRIRMSIAVTDNTLSSGSTGFILQYKETTDCTDATSWSDVDTVSGSGIWRYYNAPGVTDGDTLTSLKLTVSDVFGRYSESDPTGTNPNSVSVDQDLEWDWNIQYNGAEEAHTYCFRMVADDSTPLDAYNSDSYPKIDTRPGVSDMMRHGNFYSTGMEKGFFWSD